jgi:O-antigen/teichoic acid export membrane protein
VSDRVTAAGPGSVAGNSARMLGAQLAGNAGYFVSVLLLARGLAPAQRGAVAFVTVSALVLSSLASLGVSQATKVFVARRPADRARLLTNVMIASGCGALAGGALICAVMLGIPGVRPPEIRHVELAAIVAGGFVGAIGLAAAAFLEGTSRFGMYSQVLAAGPWAYALVLGIVWVTGGITVPRAVTAWVLAQAVAAVVLCGTAARGIGFGRPDGLLMGESLHFGVRAWLGGLAHLLNARVDQLLLGVLATQAALGMYAVAVNASEVLFYLPSAVATALLPAVARSNAAAGVERTLRVFRAVMVVTTAGVLAAAVLGPVLLPLVFGHAYAGSVEPFMWMLPSAFGFAASTVFSNALLASGAPALSSLGPVTSLVVGVPLDVMLIPPLGATGAAIAASAALLAGGVVASVAYGIRAELRPAALIPRRDDVAMLAARAIRRAGARPS